jgi:hypothetical protein
MELQKGGKFVMYQYCVSLIVFSFRGTSDIYFLRHNENAIVKGLPFTFLTFLLGWWGFPLGPVYTILILVTNLSGGEDVTQKVLASMVAANRPA